MSTVRFLFRSSTVIDSLPGFRPTPTYFLLLLLLSEWVPLSPSTTFDWWREWLSPTGKECWSPVSKPRLFSDVSPNDFEWGADLRTVLLFTSRSFDLPYDDRPLSGELSRNLPLYSRALLEIHIFYVTRLFAQRLHPRGLPFLETSVSPGFPVLQSTGRFGRPPLPLFRPLLDLSTSAPGSSSGVSTLLPDE